MASAGLLVAATALLVAALPTDDVTLLWLAVGTVGIALAVLAVGVYVDARSRRSRTSGHADEA